MLWMIIDGPILRKEVNGSNLFALANYFPVTPLESIHFLLLGTLEVRLEKSGLSLAHGPEFFPILH